MASLKIITTDIDRDSGTSRIHFGSASIIAKSRQATQDESDLHPILTHAEAEALLLRASGMTEAEAAKVIGISKGSVARRMWRAYIRMGIEGGKNTTVKAVCDAIRRGWLTLALLLVVCISNSATDATTVSVPTKPRRPASVRIVRSAKREVSGGSNGYRNGHA